jgi:multisubunit Na+/H+ antiporter MnhC subunit
LGAFFSFRTFIFPGLVKIIYWIGLIGIAVGALITVVGGIAASNNPYVSGGPALAVGAVVAGLVGGAILVVIWRVVVELWLVLFSIHDVLKEIRDRG